MYQKQLPCSLKMQMREATLERVGKSRVGLRNLLFLLRVMFYSVGTFRTSSLGDSISITLRELLWGGRGMEGQGAGRSQVIQKFCNKGRVVWTSKVFLWIKENQIISKVQEVSAFYFSMYGKTQVLGLTELIPSTGISVIWGQYAEIFHILSSSVLT